MKNLIRFFSVLLLSAGFAANLTAQIAPDIEIAAEILNGDGGSYLLRVHYEIPEGFHQTLQENFFKFEIIEPSGLETGKIRYPEGVQEGDVINFYDSASIEADIINFEADPSEELKIKAYWQLCNEEGMCLFPQSRELTALNNYTAAETAQAAAAGGHNILFFLLLAFLGGLLLNVMPCVLPVLSIKALSLVKQGGENRKQILASSLLYTAGVIVSLLVLAAVIIIIKASGEQVGWGFQFQNRGFVLVLLTIIFVFALSLFEVFTISAPVVKSGGGFQQQKKSSSGAHFFSGVIAVLLATPCTAPFLGTAAGFAFSQPAPVILAVFFMVGLGLSFPFILIGFFPAVVKKLPKPGAWMNTFREVMGFLLIGTSVWLIDVLIYQSAQGYLTRVLIYLTAVTAAAWLYGKLSSPGASTRKRISGLIIAAAIIAASAITLLGGGKLKDAESSGLTTENAQYAGWLEFSPDSAEDYIGGDRPVFIAFGAKWCMTCRTNENTVIFTDEVEDFFENNNAVLIHGDYTNKNPEIDAWMNSHGRAGVPFYTWYPAGSSEAVLLPEIITKKMITELE